MRTFSKCFLVFMLASGLSLELPGQARDEKANSTKLTSYAGAVGIFFMSVLLPLWGAVILVQKSIEANRQ